MPKPITRAGDREAIFREAELPVHTPAEIEEAPGAAEWEHNHHHHVLHWKEHQEPSPPEYMARVAVDLSPLLDPNQMDWPSTFDFVRDQGEHVKDALEGYRSIREHLGPAGEAWAGAAKAYTNNHVRQFGRPPSTQQLMDHARQHLQNNPVSTYSLGDTRLGAKPTPRYILLPHWDAGASCEIMHDHAADMAHKTASPQLTPDLMNMARTGGFTLHDHVGDAPTGGYMVSHDKNSEQMQPISTLRPEHIASFVNQHTRDLSNPNAYLGGWLDGKNFYLDVSYHRPTLDRAAHDAVNAHQLAVYDLAHGTSINTPDAVTQSGDPGLAYPDRPKNPLTAGVHEKGDGYSNKHEKGFWEDPKDLGYYEDLPAHDWLQHTLGDPEEWDEMDGKGHHEAAAFTPPPAEAPIEHPWDADKAEYVKDHPGSTHGAQVFRNPATKENWLVKPDPSGVLANLDVAANHIAAQSGVETPPTFKTTLGGNPASTQLMYPNAKDAFPKGPINPDKLSDEDLLTIQKHHALDWLIGNHDSHERQFIRTQDGKLTGIDKGQAFKYFNNDKLHWNFHPNSMYDEHEPVYNTLYRNMAIGGRQLNDPRDGELGKYIQGIQAMPDQDYQETLRPYAESAAKQGWLGKNFQGTGNNIPWTKPRFVPNDVEGFLQAALDRKNNLSNDMGDLYDRAMAHRTTGEKIAQLVAPYWVKTADIPDPTLLQNMHKQMGSHGARVYQDPQGQWLVKRPPQGAEFMVPLDRAASDIQTKAGLINPETYTLPWKDGSEVTAVKMIPGAKQAFSVPPHLGELHPNDIETLQKHQALDWLIGNHDSHVGNFMRTPGGELVGIDKGQAGKYYGRDRLDYNFHPNYYAREPIYNQLWREFANGYEGDMQDPRAKHSALGQFVQNLQNMPDAELKDVFRPYAQAAAHSGGLANPIDGYIKDQPVVDPMRNLGPATIPPNDPEAFLEAMAQRKNNLSTDLGALYDRSLSRRQQSISQNNRGDLQPTPVSMVPSSEADPTVPSPGPKLGPHKNWNGPQKIKFQFHQPEPEDDDDEDEV